MSSTRTQRGERAVSAILSRIARVWRILPSERRMAAFAAVGLFLTLFLPWYQETVVATVLVKDHAVRTPSAQSFTGWGSFSFVEAAVLVVAVSVLVLLFHRAEGRAFHLPGGDGWVITLAGAWTCFLIVWRMFDKQGVTEHGQVALSSGIEWGIFVALLVAAVLAYAGTRIRAAHELEPPLPGSDGIVFDGRWERAERAGADAVSDGVVARPATPGDAASPAASSRPRRGRRSGWRPGDAPEWSDSERPTGWLTSPAEGAPPQPPDAGPQAGDTGQLTIPLDEDQ